MKGSQLLKKYHSGFRKAKLYETDQRALHCLLVMVTVSVSLNKVQKLVSWEGLQRSSCQLLQFKERKVRPREHRQTCLSIVVN